MKSIYFSGNYRGKNRFGLEIILQNLLRFTQSTTNFFLGREHNSKRHLTTPDTAYNIGRKPTFANRQKHFPVLKQRQNTISECYRIVTQRRRSKTDQQIHNHT